MVSSLAQAEILKSTYRTLHDIRKNIYQFCSLFFLKQLLNATTALNMQFLKKMLPAFITTSATCLGSMLFYAKEENAGNKKAGDMSTKKSPPINSYCL